MNGLGVHVMCRVRLEAVLCAWRLHREAVCKESMTL